MRECLPFRHRRRGALGLAAALVAFVAPLLAADVDFCISGTVVNSLTGEPIRRAAVTTPQAANLTDSAGAFSFCQLPAGSYYANAEKPGFATAGLSVTVGPSPAGVQIRLQPLAIIKGRMLDGDGGPLENAVIQLFALRIHDGRRRVLLENTATTDDEGEYRLAGIMPGAYLLRAAGWQDASAATEKSSDKETFAPVYYGGATSLAQAAPLNLEAGSETTADFRVALQSGYTIRGFVSGYSPLAPVSIELLRTEEGLSTAHRVTFNPTTGALAIAAVAPGRYVLRATQGDGAHERIGEQVVQVVSSDVNSVRVAMGGVVALRGTVRVVQEPGLPPTPPACSLALSPADPLTGNSDVLESQTAEDGTLEIPVVLPGPYWVKMDCGAGYLASLHADDVDLLSRDDLVIPAGASPPALDAVVATDGATLDVTTTQNDQPAVASLLLVPDSGSNLHAKFAIATGKATVTQLAPGDYHAYAWTGSPDDFEFTDPNVREAWASHAVSVHLAAHDHQSITIAIPPGASH